MSRKSKSRTRRNNYKSKSGKYKKVRKTQRRTRRNRRRGGGKYFNSFKEYLGNKSKELKEKARYRFNSLNKSDFNKIIHDKALGFTHDEYGYRNSPVIHKNYKNKLLAENARYQKLKRMKESLQNNINDPSTGKSFFYYYLEKKNKVLEEMREIEQNIEPSVPNIKDMSFSSNK
jgi:hypothetical protein